MAPKLGTQIRFCTNGHDKEFVGRDKYGRCMPCRNDRARRYMRRTRYNVSDKQILDLIVLQNQKCRICKNQPKKLFIDHCHVSGRVRGMLCRLCNSMIGFAKDNTEILLSAVDYLKLNK